MTLTNHHQRRTQCAARVREKLRLKRLVAYLVLVAIAPLQASAARIDFTRHLSHHTESQHTSSEQSASGDSGTHTESFFGVPGNARLIVTSPDSEVNATILLNGLEVVTPGNDARRLEVPVTLLDDNSIAVALSGSPGSSVAVRVKQVAEVELHLQSRVHFNTNVTDFVAAREFYGRLGFKTLTGFPDTNTLDMARAIGIEPPTTYDGSKGDAAGGYLLHGELVGVGGFSGGLIDLIEFTIPKNDEPPYAGLNHLGMARAAMQTTNIAADHAYMTNAGVEFISAPTARSDGTMFAIFTDLDGTHYELIEVDGEDEATETTHIVSLAQVNVNVSDFERSRAWYQMLGFGVTTRLEPTDSIEVANAMGFEEQTEIDGAIVTLPADGSTLELVQWITPYDPTAPYPVPINHPGIHRIAFSTSDIEADVAALKAQGVEFVSPITPCCSGPDSPGGIVAFYDPDGTIVELVEQPFMAQLFAVLAWFRNTFF